MPPVDRVWRAGDLKPAREERDRDYYLATLSYAQSLLIEDKPAQALLQLTKSLSVNLSDLTVLAEWPPAYAAKRWIFENCHGGGGFLGNPVRHYQHLASRMSGPLAELRSTRAWACFHLAEKILPELPRDMPQIEKEGLEIPELPMVQRELGEKGWPGEVEVFQAVYGR